MSYTDEQHYDDAPDPEYTFNAGGDGEFTITVYVHGGAYTADIRGTNPHTHHKEEITLFDYQSEAEAVSEAVRYILEDLIPERYRNIH